MGKKKIVSAEPTRLVADCPPESSLHIYTRVSTLGQQEEGTSLQTQYEEGVHRAKQLGFQWRHWNEGGKTSNHENIAERPKLYSLYNAIRSKQVKHIFVYDQSRISRNDLVASVFRHECRKHSVTIYTKDGQYDLSNPSDNLLTQMLNAFAEFDNSVRVDKSRRGRLRRAREGFWMSGTPPYGYRVENKRLVVDAFEAQWVRLIFENRADGTSVQDIKRALDSHQVPPRFRRRWSGASIRSIIRNTHHIGYYTVVDRDAGGEFRINCEPIVSPELWRRANDAIDEEWKRRKSRPKNKTAVLFRPLILCGHCGRNFVVYDTQTTKTTVYYCPMKQREWARVGSSPDNKKRFTGCGMDRAVRVNVIEEAVIALTNKVFEDDKRYKNRFEFTVMSGHALISSRAQAIQLRRKLRELTGVRNALTAIATQAEKTSKRELAAREYSPKPAYAHRLRIKEISEEIDQINLRLDEKDRYDKFCAWLTTVKSKFSRIRELSEEEKRKVVFEIIDSIEIRFRKQSRSHVVKVSFRNPLIGSKKIEIARISQKQKIISEDVVKEI